VIGSFSPASLSAAGNTAGDAAHANIAAEGAPVTAPVPSAYALHTNYPNPFNPGTTISFDLPEASAVKLSVYNILGQHVATLVDGDVAAGYKSVEWNATNDNGVNLPSGIYIYRLEATSVTNRQYHEVRKMLYMK
jgi:hypothetical protein